MKGSNKLHALGVVLVVFGGAGLAEISTSSHGSFIVCATMFAVGFGICLKGYLNE